MRKIHGLAVVTLLTVSGAFWAAVSLAQQEPPPVAPQEGVAAKAGEKLDEFGRAIRRGLYDAEETVRGGLNKTGDTVREGFARTKESVQGMGLVPRVYGRLHWDKALHESKIEVKVQDGGTVTLTGTVADSKAKAKAVELTVETVGVVRVNDLLTTPQSTTAPAKSSGAR